MKLPSKSPKKQKRNIYEYLEEITKQKTMVAVINITITIRNLLKRNRIFLENDKPSEQFVKIMINLELIIT